MLTHTNFSLLSPHLCFSSAVQCPSVNCHLPSPSFAWAGGASGIISVFFCLVFWFYLSKECWATEFGVQIVPTSPITKCWLQDYRITGWGGETPDGRGEGLMWHSWSPQWHWDPHSSFGRPTVKPGLHTKPSWAEPSLNRNSDPSVTMLIGVLG